MVRTFLLSGLILGMLGVMIGAFGAHGIKPHVSDNMYANDQTGVQYHFYHAIALILLGLFMKVFGAYELTIWTGIFFLGGIVVFSGSLYLMALTDLRWLGAITPIGGTAFIIGWLLWIIKVWKAL